MATTKHLPRSTLPHYTVSSWSAESYSTKKPSSSTQRHQQGREQQQRNESSVPSLPNSNSFVNSNNNNNNNRQHSPQKYSSDANHSGTSPVNGTRENGGNSINGHLVPTKTYTPPTTASTLQTTLDNNSNNKNAMAQPQSSSSSPLVNFPQHVPSAESSVVDVVDQQQNPQSNRRHWRLVRGLQKVAGAGALVAVAWWGWTLLQHSSLTAATYATAADAARQGSGGAWRYYVAGGICAAVSHSVPVPLDVVKTRQQLDPHVLGRMNVWRATHHVLHHEGPAALATGLGPTCVGYLGEGALKFGVYEVLKPTVTSALCSIAALSPLYMGWVDNRILSFVLCGSVAGFVASVALCPMEALRIRLVANQEFAQQQSSWVQGFLYMIREEGFYSLWKGLVPMIYKQVPYTITKNVSFDLMTRNAYLILASYGVAITSTTLFTVPLVAAIVASILSCISSQPGDLVLSLVNASANEKRGAHQVMADLWNSGIRTNDGQRRRVGGLGAFFVGMKPRMLHVGIIVTIQLIVYDFVKRLCGIAATGTV